MSETRKLAAIVVADVVGYSRLAGADEDRTLARLRGLRSDLIDPAIAAHHGRIIKRTGDGSIIEFRSVVDGALRPRGADRHGRAQRRAAARTSHRVSHRRSSGRRCRGSRRRSYGRWRERRGPARRDLRTGPNLSLGRRLPAGQVAARASGGRPRAAKPQEHRRASARLPLAPRRARAAKTAPAGGEDARRLGALAGACGALALLLLAAGGYAWRAGYAPRLLGASVDDKLTNAPKLSIVVLPFENLSGDKEQDYFADGITDDLTTDLSHLPDSFVIARNTAFTYRGKPVDVKEIGKDLGVRYLLEGSVRRLGEKVEINAQLISTETGAHLWADRFEGERSKLGEMQVDVVARLANSLGAELVKAEALRSMRDRPGNPDAVDLAMQAQVKRELQDSKATTNEAVTLAERALALDPQNVRALTVLADALLDRVTDQWSDDPAGDIARAEKTIDAALALQPENSSVHHAKGYLYFAKQQWGPAITEFETATALDPNDASAYADGGFSKMFVSRSEDGLAGVETALRLSPRDSSMLPWWQLYMCALQVDLSHNEQAIPWCNKAVAGLPQVHIPLLFLATANAWAGHDKEAKDAAAQLQKVYPGYTVQTWAGMHWSDDPAFNTRYQRMVEGLRKAGVPEGEKKTD